MPLNPPKVFWWSVALWIWAVTIALFVLVYRVQWLSVDFGERRLELSRNSEKVARSSEKVARSSEQVTEVVQDVARHEEALREQDRQLQKAYQAKMRDIEKKVASLKTKPGEADKIRRELLEDAKLLPKLDPALLDDARRKRWLADLTAATKTMDVVRKSMATQRTLD